MKAVFKGICKGCGHSIEIDQEIRSVRGAGWMHDGCAGERAEPSKKQRKGKQRAKVKVPTTQEIRDDARDREAYRRVRLEVFREGVRRVPCPSCRAVIGERCHRESQELQQVHQRRIDALEGADPGFRERLREEAKQVWRAGMSMQADPVLDALTRGSSIR